MLPVLLVLEERVIRVLPGSRADADSKVEFREDGSDDGVGAPGAREDAAKEEDPAEAPLLPPTAPRFEDGWRCGELSDARRDISIHRPPARSGHPGGKRGAFSGHG